MNLTRSALSAAALSLLGCNDHGSTHAVPPRPSSADGPSWDQEFDGSSASSRIKLAESDFNDIVRRWQLQHGSRPDESASERFFRLLPRVPPHLLELTESEKRGVKYDGFLGFGSWLLLKGASAAISDEEFRAGRKIETAPGDSTLEFVETGYVPDPIRRWIDGIQEPLEHITAALDLPIPFLDFDEHPEYFKLGEVEARIDDASFAIRCLAAISSADHHPDASIAILTSYLVFLSRLPVLPREGDHHHVFELRHDALQLLSAVVRAEGCSEESIPRLRAVIEGDSAASLRRQVVDVLRWHWLFAIGSHSRLLNCSVARTQGIPKGFADRLQATGIRFGSLDRTQLLLAEDEIWQSIQAAFVDEADWRRAFDRATKSIDAAASGDTGSKPVGPDLSRSRLRRIAAALWLDYFRMDLEGSLSFLSGSLKSFEDRCRLSVALLLARAETNARKEPPDATIPSEPLPVDPVFGLPPTVERATGATDAKVSVDDSIREAKRLGEQISRDFDRIESQLRAAFPARDN